jgi:hypothetical protein
MVTTLFTKGLCEIPVKPLCGRNFGKLIDFVVNADGVPRGCAEPHRKEYRADGAGGAVRAVTGHQTQDIHDSSRRNSAPGGFLMYCRLLVHYPLVIYESG